MTSSVDGSPTSTPCGTPLGGAPKFGTLIPNRIFVGGIAANTTEQDLKQFFSTYGAVKDSKIIADRAGVSKGYGFITFENQEDAERIIKKEVSVDADNLVFRDRKLNIGPAIRKQQVLPRAFESPVAQGTVLFSNGVPYTYQNGMAVFASPDGGGYAVPQAQPQTALMVPQTPPVYVQPTYQPQTALMVPQTPPVYVQPTYQPQTALMVPQTPLVYVQPTYQPQTALMVPQTPPVYVQPTYQPQTALMVPQTPPVYVQPTYQVPLSYASSYQTSPQWASTAAAAAATTGQWRYMTQSPTTALTAAAANPYMITMQPELMYAQVPPQVYQPAEVADTTMLDTTAGVEGSILPVEPSLQLANQPTTYVTDVAAAAKAAASAGSSGLTLQQHQQNAASMASILDANPTLQYPSVNVNNISCVQSVPSLVTSTPSTCSVQSTSKLPSVSHISVAPYKKPASSVARRAAAAYTSPTFLVRNGHKVQCVMMPPKSLSAAGQVALMARPHEGTVTPPSGALA